MPATNTFLIAYCMQGIGLAAIAIYFFKILSCHWVSGPDKFTMDSVRPKNDNGTFLE